MSVQTGKRSGEEFNSACNCTIVSHNKYFLVLLVQLSMEKVVKMGFLLEKTCSSYYPAYRSMVQSIEDALEEARDIRYILVGQIKRKEWVGGWRVGGCVGGWVDGWMDGWM